MVSAQHVEKATALALHEICRDTSRCRSVGYVSTNLYEQLIGGLTLRVQFQLDSTQCYADIF
jgi:hypothetical protein